MAGKRLRRLHHIITGLEPNLVQVEMLVEKFSGGVVVLDRKARTGNAVIVGGLRNQRQGLFDACVVKIADVDLDRLGRKRKGRDQRQANRGRQPSEHSSSQCTYPSPER